MAYVYAYGSGTAEDPYQVWTAADLDGVRDYSDKYFIQMADIDLSGWNWEPLGRFGGYYNGGNFKIGNLEIDSPVSSSYRGLFGRTLDAVIENVTIENVHIKRDAAGDWTGYCGALMGYALDTVVKKCQVKNGTVYGEDNSGGLVGLAYGGSYEDCMVYDVDVYGNYLVGVFAGEMGADIIRCGAKGRTMFFTYYGSNTPYIGGFIGGHDYGSLEDCYFNGKLIIDEVMYPDATANGRYSEVAGFASYLYGDVANCYSACDIIINTADGINVSGFSYSSGGSIANSYYDLDLAGYSDDSGALPRTTAEMTYPYSDPENVYVDWDFTAIWQHDKTASINDGYPYLSWQSVPEAKVKPFLFKVPYWV